LIEWSENLCYNKDLNCAINNSAIVNYICEDNILDYSISSTGPILDYDNHNRTDVSIFGISQYSYKRTRVGENNRCVFIAISPPLLKAELLEKFKRGQLGGYKIIAHTGDARN
jgi:hypothetical protein